GGLGNITIAEAHAAQVEPDSFRCPRLGSTFQVVARAGPGRSHPCPLPPSHRSGSRPCRLRPRRTPLHLGSWPRRSFRGTPTPFIALHRRCPVKSERTKRA